MSGREAWPAPGTRGTQHTSAGVALRPWRRPGLNPSTSWSCRPTAQPGTTSFSLTCAEDAVVPTRPHPGPRLSKSAATSGPGTSPTLCLTGAGGQAAAPEPLQVAVQGCTPTTSRAQRLSHGGPRQTLTLTTSLPCHFSPLRCLLESPALSNPWFRVCTITRKHFSGS